MFSGRGNGLQRLGKVTSITPSNGIVIKTDKAPKIGMEVVDENLKVVGKVFDIIGPVSSPYAVVRPSIKEPSALLNKPLYLLLSKTKWSKKE
jgi:RNA-binding protein